MAKATTELKNLEVDRVDGVDKPATGRKFLLFKSENGSDAVMKSYGAVATAADIVLKMVRIDKHAVVSRKSAVALNGLAQVLGQDPVFVGKGFELQPYSLIDSDLDGDKRGPADESLGSNFTAKSGPASMVGSVEFALKDEGTVSKAWPPAKDDEDDTEEGDAKDEDKKDKKPWEMSKGVDGADFVALVKTVATLADTVAKAIAGPVEKSEGDEPERVEKRQPKSRQVDVDEPVVVRKSRSDELRLGVSFANIAFGDKK